MTRLRIMVPVVVIIAVIAYLVGGRDQKGSLDSLHVGDCIATPDATGFTTVDVVDCSKPHTQEVYAIGSTKEKVSTGPNADSDPELYRICRTEVDRRIIRVLNASRVADAGFLIGSDRGRSRRDQAPGRSASRRPLELCRRSDTDFRPC